MPRFAPLAIACGTVLSFGCGGSTELVPLGSSSGQGGDGSSSSSSTAETGAGGASGTSDVSSGVSSSSSTGATTGVGGSSGATTSTSTSTSTSASSSGSGGSPPAPVLCGGAECDPATEECCAGFGTPSCIAAGSSCQGLLLDCTGSANCGAGEICCLEGGGGPGSQPQAVCATMCMGGGPGGPGGGFGGQLCGSDAECPPGETCKLPFGGATLTFCLP